MPTPAQLKTAAEEADASRILAWIKKLEKCEGFTQWLGPKLFKAYDAAAEGILAAHAQGKTPDASAIATYHGLHDIVTSCRRDKVTASHKLKVHI